MDKDSIRENKVRLWVTGKEAIIIKKTCFSKEMESSEETGVILRKTGENLVIRLMDL